MNKLKNESNHKLKKITSISMLFGTGLEFSSAIIVSIFIGYCIDKFFNTSPISIIICMIFGFISGIMNIKRYINKYKM